MLVACLFGDESDCSGVGTGSHQQAAAADEHTDEGQRGKVSQESCTSWSPLAFHDLAVAFEVVLNVIAGIIKRVLGVVVAVFDGIARVIGGVFNVLTGVFGGVE